ncbi:hypothetical protein AAW12_05040 [Sphingobacterium sp. Ag1]|uniref:hypothetical protein n=1 Tax=Sphingobacterium sp. Ag1 TaxID=1643451 RepID=UPI0006278DB2|nr:hypothetical protein [Sphingobacterium sp. Ag1]KKO92467.1 hypothetical protein AAW12_05040 [Sphingobacterium sp. Ag1]
MKRTYLYFLSVLFSCLLVLFSCRKDIEFILDGKESPSASILENAKIYYMENINSKSGNRLDAKWKESWFLKKNGKEFLIVPAPERKLFSKDFHIRRYFTFDLENEKVQRANIVEVIGEKDDLPKKVDDLLSLSKEIPNSFNGSLLYYDINYRYNYARVYENGKLKSDVIAKVSTSPFSEFERKENINIKKATNKKSVVCPIVIPYWIKTVPTEATREGCVVTIYEETTSDQNGCITKRTFSYAGHECPSVCTTCGSGSGSGSGGSGSGIGSGNTGGNPPYGGGGALIVNNVQNPCVRKMVDSIISKDIVFTARQSLNTIFGQSNDFNLYFYDNEPLGYNNLGNCLASNIRYSQGQISGMDATIQLNSPRLSTMSQEIVAVTTVHEGVHAYLSYKGFISQNNQAQHVVMLKTYVSFMANYLINKFKTPNKEAYALAFNGLDTAFGELSSDTKQQITDGLSTSLGTVFPTLNERTTIMADYEMGYKGKKCTQPIQP